MFLIESDDTNLYGTGNATQGDYVPVRPTDHRQPRFADYGGAYYPYIVTICPNERGRRATRIRTRAMYILRCARIRARSTNAPTDADGICEWTRPAAPTLRRQLQPQRHRRRWLLHRGHLQRL